MVTGPLDGLRVFDLTRFVAGSQATAMLAALGADVVKIEAPPGDSYREQGSDPMTGQSPLFMALNSGKRSLAVEFRSPVGREAVERLLANSDFLVENARPGSLARHGLDWDAVHARHPRLVYGSISGYGDVGPDAGKGGFDLILQAEGGIMSVTGDPSSGPVKVGAPVLDVGAGLSCVIGLLAAHVERLRTGVGRLVSSSLLEFSLASLATVAVSYLASGELPGLLGTHSPTFAPYGGFRTSDGWLVMAGAGSEEMWRRACGVLGLERLPQDERFSTNGSRVKHRDELTACIEAVLTGDSSANWIARFQAAGIPAAEVQDVSQVLDRPQVTALGIVQTLDQAHVGSYRLIGAPIRLDREVLPYRRPAPALGADTRSVLAELGFSTQEVDELIDTGVAVAP